MDNNDAIVNIIRCLSFEDRRRYMTVSKFWAAQCLLASREASYYGYLYDTTPTVETYLGGCMHLQLQCCIHDDMHLLARSKVRTLPECFLINVRKGDHSGLDKLGPDDRAVIFASCATDIYRHHGIPIAPSVVDGLTTYKAHKVHFMAAARGTIHAHVRKMAALVGKHDHVIRGDMTSMSPLMVRELLLRDVKWFTLRKWVRSNMTQAAKTAIEANIQGDCMLAADIVQQLEPYQLRLMVGQIIALDKTMFDNHTTEPRNFLMACSLVFGAAFQSPQVGYSMVPLIERIADKFAHPHDTGQDELALLVSLRFWTLFSEVIQALPCPENIALLAALHRCMTRWMKTVFVNNLPADPRLLDCLIGKCKYPLDVIHLANVMILVAESGTRTVCLLTDVNCECAMLRELISRGYMTEGDALAFACRRYDAAKSRTSMDFIKWMSHEMPDMWCVECFLMCKDHVDS